MDLLKGFSTPLAPSWYATGQLQPSSPNRPRPMVVRWSPKIFNMPRLPWNKSIESYMAQLRSLHAPTLNHKESAFEHRI